MAKPIEPRLEPRAPVGEAVLRSDGPAKVTGTAMYAADYSVAGMARVQIVRSSRAHARITSIETAAAEAHPECLAVVTGEDIERDFYPRFGHIIPDHPILALDKVRYYGEPVVLVAARSNEGAMDVAALVDITYEDLDAAITVDQALADGAAVIHEEDYDRKDSALAGPDGMTGDVPNVAHVASVEWGDVDEAMHTAHVVVEDTYYYPMLYAYAMEPYNATAEFKEDSLEVVSSQQHPFMVQRDLSRIFGLPLSRIRVSVPFIGGGYGSKSYTKLEPLASVAAHYAGRPAKVLLTVEESMYTTRVDAARIWVRSGFAEDGTIVARDFDVVLDIGAYADNSPLVLDKAVNRVFGPYRIPNLRVRGRAVYTNTSPASSYRGFGAFQGNLAGETNMDVAADRLGIDPYEMRRRNLVGKGREFMPGLRPMDSDIGSNVDILEDRLGLLTAADRDRGDGLLRGAGIGCSASDAGAIPTSTAQVRIMSDGSVLLLTGATEMGQGSRTVLAQIAAAELGVPLEIVKVRQSDTATTSFERTTGASRTTTTSGVAVQRACADALTKLRDMAAEVGGVSVDDVRPGDGRMELPDGSELTFGEIVSRWYGSGGGEVTGLGTVRRADRFEQLPPFWEVGTVGVGLAIDPETGVVVVEHLVTVADIGYAVNPAGVEGQDLGAATQGLGGALFEEIHYEGAQMVNSNVVEYRVPRITDRPAAYDSVLVQRRDGVGPYGAKGAGEGALNPIGSAVASAVARATGVWPTRLPLTPERVWRLLQKKDGAPDTK